MNIAIHADVVCSDGSCGHSTRIVVDRPTRKIIQIVVKEPGFAGTERLVPVGELVSADRGKIVLGITREQLFYMDPFKTNIPAADQSFQQSGGSSSPGTMWEFMPAMPDQAVQGGQRVNFSDFDTVASHENIHEDEAAVTTSIHVEATNGKVGSLVELVVDPDGMVVTDFVMREGHLWGQHDVVIPVDAIDYVRDGVIHVGLSKEQIKELPHTPV